MPKVNTGFQATDYSAMDAATNPSKGKPPERKTKTVYPDITLRGAAAEALIGAHKLGEEVAADITFKIVRLNASKGGSQRYGSPVSDSEEGDTTVELEIMSINSEDTESPEDESKEESAEDAVDSFRASKATPEEED